VRTAQLSAVASAPSFRRAVTCSRSQVTIVPVGAPGVKMPVTPMPASARMSSAGMMPPPKAMVSAASAS